jgi:hypothetical protein
MFNSTLSHFSTYHNETIHFSFYFSHSREVEDGVVYEGNQQWEGYSMDLIDAISKILHFQYRFELVPDGECSFVSPSIAFISLNFRQVWIVQQSLKAVGWSCEAFVGQSESITISCNEGNVIVVPEKSISPFNARVYGFVVPRFNLRS